MLKRALLVAAAAAVALPLLGGTAHASCLDDVLARRYDEGYTQSPKSPYWVANHVQYSGTATVFVYGDAAVADWSSYATDDLPEYAEVVATNWSDSAADFVDCVAG